jgi:hypothetical protein
VLKPSGFRDDHSGSLFSAQLMVNLFRKPAWWYGACHLTLAMCLQVTVTASTYNIAFPDLNCVYQVRAAPGPSPRYTWTTFQEAAICLEGQNTLRASPPPSLPPRAWLIIQFGVRI